MAGPLRFGMFGFHRGADVSPEGLARRGRALGNDGLTEGNVPAHGTARIVAARLDGKTAAITVHFNADIAAVTRDAEGNLVAGTLEDAVSTDDSWTFQRNLREADPNWLLIETDDAA